MQCEGVKCGLKAPIKVCSRLDIRGEREERVGSRLLLWYVRMWNTGCERVYQWLLLRHVAEWLHGV